MHHYADVTLLSLLLYVEPKPHFLNKLSDSKKQDGLKYYRPARHRQYKSLFHHLRHHKNSYDKP